MSVGVVGSEGQATSIAVATIRKQNEAAKLEGQGTIKLLEGAARVAKNANSDPERGRIIDIHA